MANSIVIDNTSIIKILLYFYINNVLIFTQINGIVGFDCNNFESWSNNLEKTSTNLHVVS